MSILQRILMLASRTGIQTVRQYSHNPYIAKIQFLLPSCIKASTGDRQNHWDKLIQKAECTNTQEICFSTYPTRYSLAVLCNRSTVFSPGCHLTLSKRYRASQNTPDTTACRGGQFNGLNDVDLPQLNLKRNPLRYSWHSLAPPQLRNQGLKQQV